MKTSEEVYNRILTDTKFNPCNFTITYFDGIKKKYNNGLQNMLWEILNPDLMEFS